MLRRMLTTLAVVALETSLVACSSDDAGDLSSSSSAISWVSPTGDAEIDVDDVVELTVAVDDATATSVKFEVNGIAIGTCEAADECHRANLFRATTTFGAVGTQHLVATVGHETAKLDIAVRSAAPVENPEEPSDAGVDAAPGTTKDGGTSAPPMTANRGFLDPNRALHNVFGGVSWSVQDNVVGVTAAPAGSVSGVTACMKAYGTSIVKWADTYKISRASVVATAITESNCTNPTGSSDGLSSGPLQVTGSTCAALVSGYSSAACKAKMHSSPDFSFQVGAKYMGSAYQLGQSQHDPPKIAAAYNAGSVRSSTANRWHMVVTGNHIERWVGAYNAYRAWEKLPPTARATLEEATLSASEKSFAGEHVDSRATLPSSAAPNQVYFVGNWSTRDGAFVRFENGAWVDEP